MGCRKSLKVLKVEVLQSFLACFGAVLGHISIKIRLKMVRERSERGKIEKNKRFEHKKS